MCPSDNPQNSLKVKGLFYIPRPKILNFKNSFYHSCWWSVLFRSFFWFMHCAFLWCVYFKLSTTQNSFWLNNTEVPSELLVISLAIRKFTEKLGPLSLNHSFSEPQAFLLWLLFLVDVFFCCFLRDFKEDKILI